MSEYKLVPVEPIRRAIDALERFANDTLAGRNSAHELRELLAAAPAVQGEPVAWQLRTPEGRSEYRPWQLPAAWQPCPEDMREGTPYDDLEFEAVCREHEIWGTAAAAQCAVFWEAGKRVAGQKPAPDVAALVEALEAVVFYHEEVEDNDGNLMMHYSKMMRKVREALAAHRKQGGDA